MRNKFLSLAEKNLTNNFIGGKKMAATGNLADAFQNKFSLKITTTATTPRVIAILPSYFKTLGIGMEGSPAVPVPHYHNKQAFVDAGIYVDAIVDDATWVFDGDTGNISVSATEPTKRIRDFLEHIKSFTYTVNRMTIHSPNIDAYNRSLKFQQPNPFNDAQRIPLDLNQFFSVEQYQDSKIDLDFSNVVGGGWQLTPDLLLLMTVPANANVTIDFFFN